MNIIKKIFTYYNNENILNSIRSGILEWDNFNNNFYLIDSNEHDINNLHNIEVQKDALLSNTIAFANNKPANNALLWGARGTGKSSLVLSVFKEVSNKKDLLLLELKTNQIKYLSFILRKLKKSNRKSIIFCDDFSFSLENENFILFKNIIDGAASKNSDVLYYVTSNYRNVIKANNNNNNISTLKKLEITEDETALSDRFGLWLGFESFNESVYLDIVYHYIKKYNLKIDNDYARKKAIQWSILRGSRSGREALHFVKNLITIT